MIKIICIILFLVYNYISFSYLTKTFVNSIRNKKMYMACFIFNALYTAFLLKFEIIINQTLFMILFLIIICIEIRLIYKIRWLKTLLSGLYFSSNFFAINLIYISIYSIFNSIPFLEIMQDFNILLISFILTIFTLTIYLILFRLFFRIEFINIIMTDKSSVKFSIIIALIIYVDLVFNTYLLYLKDFFYLSPLLIIKMSVCCIFGFVTSIVYSYLFARLKLYAVKAKTLEQDLEQDALTIKKLENEMLYDDFTSCFKRDFVEKKIDKLLENNPFFCLAFIDIDGLKVTNDVYGHDEGDFYIKCVADILNSEFVGKVIGRVGGDEFIVVLEHTDAYATMKCVIRCFEKVNNISKRFNKPYETSISYGIVEVLPDNKLSREEIIKLADTYMYNFKKSRKKNRK